MLRKLRVVHFCHSYGGSGPGTAVKNYHEEMCRQGISSTVYCSKIQVTIKNPQVRDRIKPYNSWFQRLLEFAFSKASQLISSHQQNMFYSADLFSINRIKNISFQDYDIAIVYWINGAFLNIDEISKIPIPIIWRLSDAWPLTGGCHFPASCDGFTRNCENCPAVVEPLGRFLPKYFLHKKRNLLARRNIVTVAPSELLINQLQRNKNQTIYQKIRSIKTGVNRDTFFFNEIYLPRPLFEIVFLWTGDKAQDQRKGSCIALEVVEELGPLNSFMRFTHIGGGLLPRGRNLTNVSSLGRISANDLAGRFREADLFLMPAIHDNCPNIVLEAMCCGCPVLGCRSGSLDEIIEDNVTGYLADRSYIENICTRIRAIVTEDVGKRLEIRRNASEYVRVRHDIRSTTNSMMKLCLEVLNHDDRTEKSG